MDKAPQQATSQSWSSYFVYGLVGLNVILLLIVIWLQLTVKKYRDERSAMLMQSRPPVPQPAEQPPAQQPPTQPSSTSAADAV